MMIQNEIPESQIKSHQDQPPRGVMLEPLLNHLNVMNLDINHADGCIGILAFRTRIMTIQMSWTSSCRFDWAGDSLPVHPFHLCWLWHHHRHDHQRPLQPGHQSRCVADVAQWNWLQPTQRCQRLCTKFIYNNVSSCIKYLTPLFVVFVCVFSHKGPHFLRGSDGSSVPGPGS